MDELLAVLRTSLLFLFEGNRYRLASSRIFSPLGDAEIRIDSADLSWLLVTERSRVVLVLQSPNDPSTEFGTGVLFELLEGREHPTDLFSAETAMWIEQNLDEIERRFRDETDATLARLDQIKQDRARRRYGPRIGEE